MPQSIYLKTFLIDPQIKPKNYIDLLEPLYFQKYQENSDFFIHDVLWREWRFRGPLFTGVAAAISFCIQVIRPPEYLQDKNLLIPSEFETCIDKLLIQKAFIH